MCTKHAQVKYVLIPPKEEEIKTHSLKHTLIHSYSHKQERSDSRKRLNPSFWIMRNMIYVVPLLCSVVVPRGHRRAGIVDNLCRRCFSIFQVATAYTYVPAFETSCILALWYARLANSVSVCVTSSIICLFLVFCGCSHCRVILSMMPTNERHSKFWATSLKSGHGYLSIWNSFQGFVSAIRERTGTPKKTLFVCISCVCFSGVC